MIAKKKAKVKTDPSFTDSRNASKKPTGKKWSSIEFAACGADVSLSSISLGVIAKTADGKVRTGATSVRWEKGHDYFDRLAVAARAHEIMYDLYADAKIQPDLAQVFIAVEEAVAIGYLQRAQSSWVKQQLQISGAFLGGLVRWGYRNVYEIQAHQWQKLVADDLGITTHHTKWNPDKKVGKYRAQQWVEQFHPQWDGHWPDIITDTKRGQIPRPEGRKAQGVQSDDRYEALAMAHWMRNEIKLMGAN